jgi:uncharacterized membrane protein YobD (UPF0266 family)
MNKGTVSRFFATVGAALLIVAAFVIGIPHVLFKEGGLFWVDLGLAFSMTSFAIDHWPSRGPRQNAPTPTPIV